MDSNSNRAEFLKRIWGLSAKLIGGMAGVTVLIATDNKYFGAATGTVAAHVLEHVGKEMIERRLTPRQEIRVGRAVSVACIRLRDHIERGTGLRSDGFFQGDMHCRSASEEITEAVLQAAMNSAEERKVDFIGALLANLAVRPSIDVPTAHLLIQLANSLTYRSFALLRISGMLHAYGPMPRASGTAIVLPVELQSLMNETYDLLTRGLVELKDKAEDTDVYLVNHPGDMDPARTHLTAVGRLLFEGLELARMDQADPMYVRTVAQLSQIAATKSGNTIIDGSTF